MSGAAGGAPAPRTSAPRGAARWIAATRPAFLSVTAVAVLLGIAAGGFAGAELRGPEAAVTLAGALAAHAGANVLNDYFDARNGTDAINVGRLAPFTGGSRLIQEGVLGARATAVFGILLLASVVPAGLWLAARSGPGLIGLGVAGLAIGWAYSAPPLALMCRGLGELAVAAGWWLVVAGAAYVQRGALDPAAAVAGAAFAASVTAILFVNQFPDRVADAAVGKRNLLVRIGPAHGRVAYAAIVAAAQAIPVIGVAAGVLPVACLAGLIAAPLAAVGAREVARHGFEPSRLAPAIRATIAAAHLHGLLLAGAFATAVA